MRIPLNWLKEYVDTKKSDKEIAKSFTSLGLMLEKLQDGVMDLEHRFDRSDWLGILGCARDFAAFDKTELKKPQTYTAKGKELPGEREFKGGVEIRNECPDIVFRFNTRVFKNVKVKESPDWLKERLTSYGIPAINNIVDITNYVMVETGQPMHAQDLAKFSKKEIVLRRAKKGEEITTLDGTLIKLDPEIFVLSQNDEAIVIGGVVGGRKTAVDEKTKDIVLDAGNYNQSNVRKTARKLKIQNETVLRYDKFLNPEGAKYAIERAAQLILDLAGGEYYENYDYYPNPVKPKHMTLRMSRLLKIGGISFRINDVEKVLTRLEYKVLKKDKDLLELEVPYFRTDVEVEDDIVSDILRIGNYDNIPVEVINAAPPEEITDDIYKFEDELRDILVNLGLHEYISDPLVSTDKNQSNQVLLQNSLSSEKNALRTNLYQTLKPIIETYSKHGIKETGIFEIGKTYFTAKKTGKTPRFASAIDGYLEPRMLEIIYSDQSKNHFETSQKIKALAAALWSSLGITKIEHKRDNGKVYIYGHDIKVAEIRYDSLTVWIEELIKVKRDILRVINDYQNLSTEDLSLVGQIGKDFGPVYKFINEFHHDIENVEVVEEYLGEKLEKSQKGVTLKVLYKNLTGAEFQKIKVQMIKELGSQFSVQVRV